MKGRKRFLSLLALCLFLAGFGFAAPCRAELKVFQLDERNKKETIDPERYPSQDAYAVGERLAGEVAGRFREKGGYPQRVAAVVWGKETAGREGPMVSFVLALLGVRPEWNPSGKVVGLKLIGSSELGRPRLDTTVVTTGLFRDLFKSQILLLDRAFRLALAASYRTLAATYPDLQPALDAALAPLGKTGPPVKGDEPLDRNYVAGNWALMVQKLLATGHQPGDAGELAIARIFAPPPGEYGAGVNAVESMRETERMAEQFATHLGHVYSGTEWGTFRPEFFKEMLQGCNVLFHCNSESAILDQDDLPLEYTYVPGLSSALEKWGGGGVEKLIGTSRGIQGGAPGGVQEQQKDNRSRLGERGTLKTESDGDRTAPPEAAPKMTATASLGTQRGGATQGVKPGPQVFEMEVVSSSPARAREQNFPWSVLGAFAALFAAGGCKGFVRQSREFGQATQAGYCWLLRRL